MLNFGKKRNQRKNFIGLTGVNYEDFKEIAEKVSPQWNDLQKKKKISGRNSHLKSLEDEFLLVPIYYRFYTRFVFLGYLFNLDASNVCRHLQKIEPLLAKSIGIKKIAS